MSQENADDVKPPRRRRLLRIFGIAVAGLGVLLIALTIFLHTPPAKRFILARVATLLREENIDFDTDELGYNLLDLSLDVRNVRVKSREAPDLPPFATIDRASIDLSLLQVVRGRYVIESGDAQGVAVHYFVGDDGRDNLPRAPRDPEQPSQPLEYLVDHLAITNGRVRYQNLPQRIDVSLPISSIDIDGNPLTDRHAVRLESAGGTVAAQGRSATLDTLSGDLDLGRDDANINSLAVTAEGSQLTLSGTITGFADPQADLAVKGRVDAGRASTLAALKDPIGGVLDVALTAKGPIATPALAGTATGTGLSYRNIQDVQLATTGEYDMREQRATFSTLQVRAPWGGVSGEGSVALAGDGESRVRADVTGVDAAALMQAFDLPYVVASRVDGRVQARWPGLRYLAATGQATVALTPTRSGVSRSVIAVGGRIDATGNAGRIDAQLRNVTAAGADITGRLSIARQQDLAGALRVRVADIGRSVAAAEAFLGRARGSMLPTPVGGALVADTRLGGTLRSPLVNAAVAAPDLRVGSASGLAARSNLTYSPAVLTVHSFDLTWQQARAYAAGRIDLVGARRLNLTVNADALEVAEVLRAFNQTGVPASGTISMQGTVTGTATRPAGALTLTGNDLVVYQELLGRLTANVALAGRDIAVSQLLLDKPQPEQNGRVAGSASYNLDTQAFTADLRSTNLQLLSLVLPNGQPLRGPVELTAKGTGTVAAPSATVALASNQLQLGPYDLGRMAVDAVVANRQADVKASADRFGVNAVARIGVEHPYPATMQVAVNDLQLAALPIELQTPLTGSVRATIDASGNLAAPEQMAGTARVDAFAGAWNGHAFRIDTPTVMSYVNERLGIESLRVVAQDSTVTVSGELPLTDRAGQGEIGVTGRANLATLAQYAPAGSNLTAAGDLTLDGRIRGTLKAIDPDLVLTVTNGALQTPQLQPGVSNLNLRAHVVNGEANIERLAANWGTARVTASGRIPLEAVPALPVEIPRKGGPATFTARVEGLDPSQIPGVPAGLTGRITLDAQVAAARADLAALEGRITFPELQLAFNGLTLAQQQPSAIRIAAGTATVDQLNLTGSVGTIAATGTVGLLGVRPIDVDVNGNLNIAVLSVFTDAVRAEGDTRLQIAARGTVSAPELNGFVDLADGRFVVDEPTIAAENVSARIDLSGRRISIARLNAALNGGTLTGSGFATLGEGGLADVDLEVVADDVAFDAPLDLRSLSDAKIRMTKSGDDFLVNGQVTIDEAGLTGDINFDEGLLAAMTSRKRLDLTEERNATLERIRLNIDVDTASPILVDNNLARAEVNADLRVVGTPYQPGLAGRLTVLEDGEITLNERRYQVERATLTFIDERRIFPSFDLLLNTSARNYDITITVTGTPGDTETSLTSDPALPEPDIMALLVTGRTLEEMRGEEFEVAREQVLSYLAGRVGSQLGRGIEKATGLSEVRIEPNLIANEANPSARLTVGQELTDDLKLIYSTNLTDSNDQIWVAEYDVTRRFQTRTVRQSDNSYRFDIRHDMRFGGTPAPRRVPRQRPIVQAVNITTDRQISETELREMLDVEAGKPYDFFAARNGVEDIEKEFLERGWLQSRVRLQRQGDQQGVVVNLRAITGPRVDLQFQGAAPPSRVVDEIRTKWTRGVFDTQRLDDSNEVIRGWLASDNFLQSKITSTVQEVSPAERRVAFQIDPGPRSQQVVLAFEGAAGIDPKELDDIINEQNLEQQLFTDPTQVTELLERFYREQGYLVAEVDAPKYEFNGPQARVVLAVREGPRFVVRDVSTDGNAVVPTAQLVGRLPVVPGDPFLPFAAENALDSIRDVYWRRGYNDVRSDYELVLDRAAGRVDVRFTVAEGRQTVVAEIAVTGNDKTSDRLVREQVELDTPQPLDISALAKSRRNLYDTGAFSIVDIAREEIAADPAAGAAVAGQKPVRLNVSVREVQPIQLRYGASYDTERGLGGIVDLSNHNSLGKARVLGVRARYDAQVREGRLYLSQPALRYFPIQLTGTLYYVDERNPKTGLTGQFNVDRRGVSLQGETELRNLYVWSYGYRYERAHTFDPAPGGTLDRVLTVSPLTSTITREGRDEVLDATRGSFLSQGFAYSPSWLGSDTPYLRYFGQYFHYFPLQRERRERFTNEILRPRFVFATGARLGLARGIGSTVPLSERFFAGGSTSLRGFEQNAVGAIGADRLPAGGDAMLVINNELRFPLVSIFDGVVFSDIGNIFPRVSDFSFSDLREAAGLGLRVRTPWFLLRGDYGVILDRREGERRSRFYFSIGQAF